LTFAPSGEGIERRQPIENHLDLHLRHDVVFYLHVRVRAGADGRLPDPDHPRLDAGEHLHEGGHLEGYDTLSTAFPNPSTTHLMSDVRDDARLVHRLRDLRPCAFTYTQQATPSIFLSRASSFAGTFPFTNFM